ncbi:alpha/beta hydrolase [Acaricomes phytoseiuli]|uniref:alpha/beta hydrolase n=1 Tax=Acaricomes phytoseiuli TaxID=291968 RepID=UPI00146162FD|nr:alpha/beta hydrolase [Acaricomes phytoseiuli]
MGRDWSLLGGDPAPGELDDVLSWATFWQSEAERMGAGQSEVSVISVRRSGVVVTAVADLVAANARILGSVSELCGCNAGIYRQWYELLAEAQRATDRLLGRAEEALSQRTAAEALVGLPRPAALADQEFALSRPGQRVMADWQLQIGRGQGMLSFADDELQLIRAQAQQLREQVQSDRLAIGNRLGQAELSAMLRDAPQLGRASVDSSLAGFLAPALKADPALARSRDLLRRAEAGDQQAQQDYLTLLAGFSQAQLSLLAVAFPSARTAALSLVNAGWVKSWWKGSAGRQQALAVVAPGLIGNLNGVPYQVRDHANRRLLGYLRAQPGQSQAVRDAIAGIDQSLTYDDGSPRDNRFLISFDLNGGKPLAAVSIGDLDTAGNISYAIPGMGTTVAPGGINSWTDTSQVLYRQQELALRRLGEDPSLAVVSWIGYEAPASFPGSSEVFANDQAVAGGTRLAAALDGLQIARQGSAAGAPALNVVAHSYGSTTAVYALAQTSQPVASATFVGSAGIDPNVARSAGELNVLKSDSGAVQVYATSSDMDWVAVGGVLGAQGNAVAGSLGDLLTDPAGAGARFVDTVINQRPADMRVYPTDWISWPGATEFSSRGGTDPQTGEELAPVYGHQANGSGFWAPWNAPTGGGYFDQKTESLRNIALISVGRGNEITP